MNIPPPLLPLFDQGLVDSVIRPLMSGKEASVYLVTAQGHPCVAKVYKDAQHRSFRQRAAYSEGRQVRNSRQRRAMQKGSAYGKSLLENEWQNSEVNALYHLHEAGVRVPVPFHHGENVLLMELVSDEEGEPAPRLYDLDLSEAAATKLHAQLIEQVVRILCAGLVHGDLSEYNILMGFDGPVIIDLPQTTDAATNNNAERLFLRDVQNLASFLGRSAPALRKTRFGPEIWDLYARAELRPDSPLTGRFEKKQKKVDPRQAMAEIRAAAEEAETRPLSAYQLKKKRRAEEAREAREAEEAEQARRTERGARRGTNRGARDDARPSGRGRASARGDRSRDDRSRDDRPRDDRPRDERSTRGRGAPSRRPPEDPRRAREGRSERSGGGRGRAERPQEAAADQGPRRGRTGRTQRDQRGAEGRDDTRRAARPERDAGAGRGRDRGRPEHANGRRPRQGEATEGRARRGSEARGRAASRDAGSSTAERPDRAATGNGEAAPKKKRRRRRRGGAGRPNAGAGPTSPPPS